MQPRKITTEAEWSETQERRIKWSQENYPDKPYADGQRKTYDETRLRFIAMRAKFPNYVILSGDYPYHDYVTRWCWQQFGSYDQKCIEHYSEYPACPLVLATEHLLPGWKDELFKHYKNPGEHEHAGSWCPVWLGKTGYNYGEQAYCFLSEEHRDRFIAAVPSFTIGEENERE